MGNIKKFENFFSKVKSLATPEDHITSKVEVYDRIKVKDVLNKAIKEGEIQLNGISLEELIRRIDSKSNGYYPGDFGPM